MGNQRILPPVRGHLYPLAIWNYHLHPLTDLPRLFHLLYLHLHYYHYLYHQVIELGFLHFSLQLLTLQDHLRHLHSRLHNYPSLAITPAVAAITKRIITTAEVQVISRNRKISQQIMQDSIQSLRILLHLQSCPIITTIPPHQPILDSKVAIATLRKSSFRIMMNAHLREEVKV